MPKRSLCAPGSAFLKPDCHADICELYLSSAHDRNAISVLRCVSLLPFLGCEFSLLCRFDVTSIAWTVPESGIFIVTEFFFNLHFLFFCFVFCEFVSRWINVVYCLTSGFSFLSSIYLMLVCWIFLIWNLSCACIKLHLYEYLRMYLWWSLCTLYLHACQVRVTVGDSGLCCCTFVTSSAN